MLTALITDNKNNVIKRSLPDKDFKKVVIDSNVIYQNSEEEMAVCPGCRCAVQPKCGNLITWYWSHLPKINCKFETEKETEWHLNWKAALPIEYTEIIIGNNRTDAISLNHVAVEFQHSAISIEEIDSRNEAYKKGVSFEKGLLRQNVVWVLDAKDAKIETRGKPSFADNAKIQFINWLNYKKSFWHSTIVNGHLFLDLNDGRLLHILKKVNDRGKFVGYYLDKLSFINNFLLAKNADKFFNFIAEIEDRYCVDCSETIVYYSWCNYNYFNYCDHCQKTIHFECRKKTFVKLPGIVSTDYLCSNCLQVYEKKHYSEYETDELNRGAGCCRICMRKNPEMVCDWCKHMMCNSYDCKGKVDYEKDFVCCAYCWKYESVQSYLRRLKPPATA